MDNVLRGFGVVLIYSDGEKKKKERKNEKKYMGEKREKLRSH